MVRNSIRFQKGLSLLDFQRLHGTEEHCVAALEWSRWPTGFCCPRCAHGQPLPPKCGPLPKDADATTRMTRKQRSKKVSRIYAQRKAIVVLVNGEIKEARGLRRFLLRGIGKVNLEWHLIIATHNPLKLFRFQRSQQQLAEEQWPWSERPGLVQTTTMGMLTRRKDPQLYSSGSGVRRDRRVAALLAIHFYVPLAGQLD
jgi:hypothetical protein